MSAQTQHLFATEFLKRQAYPPSTRKNSTIFFAAGITGELWQLELGRMSSTSAPISLSTITSPGDASVSEWKEARTVRKTGNKITRGSLYKAYLLFL